VPSENQPHLDLGHRVTRDLVGEHDALGGSHMTMARRWTVPRLALADAAEPPPDPDGPAAPAETARSSAPG
jgi:hypothetical protein